MIITQMNIIFAETTVVAEFQHFVCVFVASGNIYPSSVHRLDNPSSV